MRYGFLAGLLICAATPLPAAAQAATASPAIDPVVAERAMALARVLNSEQIIIGDSGSDQRALALAAQIMAGNPDFAALDKEYPGISRELMEALLPLINRSSRERLPQLWERQAALYGRNFNAGELQTLILFYQSPTGQKLIRLMMDKMDSTRSVAELSKRGDVSAGAVLADVQATGQKVAAEMDETDKAALLRLIGSGLMPRIQAISLETQQLALSWYDESAPWEEEAMEKAILRIVEKYEGTQK